MLIEEPCSECKNIVVEILNSSADVPFSDLFPQNTSFLDDVLVRCIDNLVPMSI